MPPTTVAHQEPDGRLAALWLHGPDFARTGEAAESIAAQIEWAGWVVLAARIDGSRPLLGRPISCLLARPEW
ncbi:hypothetical protein [Actinoplanes sp. NPDC020271]|uniref:hypothetical protein n=1 Tax=Actinoplanes sp. NPDC020271 TaxID=3363896 RepID=UPI0037B288E1